MKPELPSLLSESQESRVRRLEELVGEFAGELSGAQEDGIGYAVLMPRLMFAFRQHFGEPPPGFALPALPGLPG